MWGIIPAAGQGTRIQPLAFSKELLPVGTRFEGGTERPRAVSEYLVERLAHGGARKICFVISPHKDDILRYFSDRVGGVDFAFVIQPRAAGLCDAIFRAAPLIHPEEPVAVGLPDTIWFPEDALASLPDDRFSFLTFPVEEPRHFDAVVAEADGRIREIQVKNPNATSRWIWGAFKMPGRIFHELHALWLEREREDEYLGTLVNAWIACGGEAWDAPLGTGYVDVGTLHGYREALRLLGALEPATDRA
ncbi:sugar phosphate nucleotidyltransferase [Phenylobacterium sp.]|uniref:sugar phosphate nucleotidyltransferase n=1 Tax=Phenylobacterium sp. TaxID=1871053 RepID=UPI0035AEDF5C